MKWWDGAGQDGWLAGGRLICLGFRESEYCPSRLVVQGQTKDDDDHYYWSGALFGLETGAGQGIQHGVCKYFGWLGGGVVLFYSITVVTYIWF